MPGLAAGIAGIATAIGTAVAGSAVLQGVISLGISAGLTLLSRVLAPKPDAPEQQTGIRSDVTTTGGTQPQGFVLGRYATAGHHVCPPMVSNASNNDVTYVIELSDLPGVRVRRLIVDGQYSAIEGSDAAAPANSGLGKYITGLRNAAGTDHGWIRFHDGNQTAADQYLVATFASYPDRPWSANHIGTGTAYAVCTFRFNQEIFSGLPSVIFEIDGVPLYDPRLDTTAGGDGPHRFADQSTWEFTDNPAVMVYNIMRGIELADGTVYGGETAAADLPYDNWIAAMNACDVVIDGRPQFTAGFEVQVTDEPASVIEELLKSCIGQMSEQGGVWRIRVGEPAAPVYSFSDGDVVISNERSFSLHPGLKDIHNGVTVSYVEPTSLWETREADPIFSAALETEDGGRRLVTSLALPAVYDANQARQIGQSLINDNRRFRTATLTLPPDAIVVEPLDTVSWTSPLNGWTAKLWEVVSVTDDPTSLQQTVTLREREPADYDWTASDELPAPVASGGIVLPTAQPLEQWAVVAGSITDGSNPRRPALTLSWSGTRAQEADFVRWQVRRATTTEVIASGVAETEAGKVTVTAGILGNTAYEARGRYVMKRPTEWSDWLAATTPDVRLGSADIDPQILADIVAAQNAANAADQAVDDLFADVIVPEIARIDLLEVEIPQIATVGSLAEESLERLLDERLRLDLLDQRITDAGVYVDAETGTVRISGVASLEDRVNTAEVVVDGLNAEISLRATTAYVDGAITNALLDPTQIPVFTDFDVRLTTAEVDIDAVEGSISSTIDALTVSGDVVTMTSVTDRLTTAETAITNRVTTATFTDVETRLGAAETSISTIGDVPSIVSTVNATREQYVESDQDIERNLADLINRDMNEEAIRSGAARARTELTSSVNEKFVAESKARTLLTAEIGSVKADFIAETVVRASADEALAENITQLTATLGTATGNIAGTSAALTSLTTRVTSAEGTITSLSSDVTQLESGLTSAEGSITSTASAVSALTTRVTSAEGDVTAIASDVTQLESELGTAQASISNLAATRVTSAGAISAVEGTISAQYNSLLALAQATSSAQATATEVIARQFLSVTTSVGGTANLELISYDTAQGSGTQISLRGDRILIDGSVPSAKIGVLDAGKITTGTLDAQRIKLDGQTVERASDGNLRIKGSGVARAQLADGAVSDTARVTDATIRSVPASNGTSINLELIDTPDETVIEVYFSAEIENGAEIKPVYAIASQTGDPYLTYNDLQPSTQFGYGVGNGFKKWTAAGTAGGGVRGIKFGLRYFNPFAGTSSRIRNVVIKSRIVRK